MLLLEELELSFSFAGLFAEDDDGDEAEEEGDKGEGTCNQE